MPATTELLQEGRYRITQPSSQSGEETIFEAYDTVRNTNVVVREIPVRFNKVATVSQRESLNLAFATQAKALTEIEHDALSHVHDYFSEIDRQYLVMEAVEGESLAQLIRSRNKPFSIAEVTKWADELLDALGYLHARKPPIIHRNINPSNVKLSASGKIKLLGVAVDSSADSDFVTANIETDELHYSPMEQIWPGLDAASQKVITNSYDDRSERILKQPMDERSDIYSLGATLYFLITGVEPVDPIERSIEILEGKLDPLREPSKVDSQIPADISDVLMKALEIKRENRFDSALIMRQVLQTAIGRVREREEEDVREQHEAAELERSAAQANTANEDRAKAEAEANRRAAEAAELRMKQQAESDAEAKRKADAEAEAKRQAEADAKHQAAIAEQKMREAQAEERRQKDMMEQQLREAEEQRVTAEEAQLLEEANVAASTFPEETALPDASVLDIPATAEVMAYREPSSAVEDDELAAVLRELEEAESKSQGRPLPGTPAKDTNVDLVYEAPIDTAPQPDASKQDDDIDGIFSVPEKTGFSLPVPAIAGLVGLVLVIAIGGWFVMSGSSKPEPQPEAAVQVAQPAPVETPDPIVTSADIQTEAAPDTVQVQEQPVATAKAAPKQKKPDPKGEPAKKKVTADDLINDN